MIYAIVGDILGSSIEFAPVKPLIDKLDISALAAKGSITDDTVMTLATWRWWMDYRKGSAKTKDYVDYLRKYFFQTPKIGYGPMFFEFMRSGKRPSIPSCGNGAAMRVSALGLDSDTPIDEMMDLVKNLTLQTHEHPEAVKGAQAVVYVGKRLQHERQVWRSSVDLNVRAEFRKDLLKEVETRFGYNLNLNYDSLVKEKFDATCQGSVPKAIWCVLSSSNIDEAFKKALTIGGDTDTIACMTGGMAQLAYDCELTGVNVEALVGQKLKDTGVPELAQTHLESVKWVGISQQAES